MKYTQTISIEQKYGKYLFDKKIKTKKVLSKQVSITKEDINTAKNNIESQFRDVKGDKKKLIQIIQSFEDPLSPDKVTLENLSFISDINASDTKFTIQLKEELPKIKHESIKPDFFCNAIVRTKNIDSELNLLDFKKNYFIEPLLNNFNINTQKDIKSVNNDNFENNHNNINEDIDEDEDENKIKDDNIGNKDNRNDCNNNNEENQNKDENNNEDIESNSDEENKSNIESNLDEDNNNKDEKKEEENEENEEEELSKKKKNLIIKSLIYFNKDGIINGIENFKKRIPDYNKSKYEEDNKFEKNVYIRIEDRIREYLNKYKCDKLSQLRDFENSYLLKIINFQKKSVNYKNISIKGIIIGLLNIINDFVGKEYLKIYQDNIKNDNYEKGEYFLDLYEKYEIMKKFCFYLQKDFILLIDNFKEDINFEFTFDALFSDIYWDYVFRIKELYLYFINNYNNDKISKKANETMDNIIDILFNIDLPYKKMFGDILNMSCIKKENIYLMNYIIKYRKLLFKNDKENINININNKTNEIDNYNEIENDKKLHTSSSCDKILNNKINNIEEEENNINSKEEENNKNKINKDDNNSINIIREDINTNDDNNLNNNINNDNDDKKLDLNLGKSLSMDICNNKLSDKDSLEKVYNYILYGENENEKKKQKKRHKKRKKNKINNSLNMEEKEEEEQIDPVVEEYKNYINNINQNCIEYVKKIKPNIKEEWINYISTSIDE